MSDDRSPDHDGTEGDESTDDGQSGGGAPGGGPRRVVSERSVDDILSSLDETTGDTADDGDRTDELETSTDEAELPSDEPRAATSEPRAASDESRPTTETAPPSTVDGSEPTVDDTVDALKARIDSGDVTGSDVRAAETGGGRESTPEIDEIELSMDDLDTGESTAGPPSEVIGERASGAETIRDDRNRDRTDAVGGEAKTDASTAVSGDDADSDDDSSGDERTGLFGRIARLFSR
ncbi:hypothetical protein EA462_05930 [Natrarchaeobius halalkaliphilus]|uniref:Uncharacterized protein n=1 Tax=Natrarchaeobius halalkaliphilus TaxID=1679091 RepID=A0A3N6P1S9_9EURY|nr:hypothetical protein [Natrarchaeobius halalkaliphilus]RQG91499.1 hypothetical protein EA462_05930 [Natrarchaeobius halalkaliphilus]